MVISIKTYLNQYVTIQNSINMIQSQSNALQKESDYLTNFEIPYQKSQYAPLYFAHSHGILAINEYLVKIDATSNVLQATDTTINTKNNIGSGRMQYLWKKLNAIQ